MVAFVWVSIWLRFGDFEPEVRPEPTDLRAWDFLGCYQLQIDPWVEGEPEASPPFIRHLMLLPDSLDQWGRAYPTYQAIPLTPETDTDDILVRWFTRADTLWFVWSDPAARGAAALRRMGDRLLGRAVAELFADSAQLESTAAAWEVNCHSLRPDRIGPVRR